MCIKAAGVPGSPEDCTSELMPASDGDCRVDACVEASGDEAEVNPVEEDDLKGNPLIRN
jgi:hypothetical protein